MPSTPGAAGDHDKGEMMLKRAVLAAALVAGVGVGLAACGGGGDNEGAATGSTAATSTGAGTATKGGTYRVEVSDFGFTNGFDPTGEYLGLAWDYYFDDGQGRAVSVDARAILEALRKVYGADALVRELVNRGNRP